MTVELPRETPVQDAVADELKLDSATLARLVSEVRNNETFEPNAYNRQHNRHNR